MKIIIAIFVILFSLDACSKPIIHTVQQFINRAAMNTDTIFVGKILEKKEIEDGFILDNISSPIGILKVEVLKVYRGKIKANEQQFVCTWFDRTEHIFAFENGREFTFFGIKTDSNIQLKYLGIYFCINRFGTRIFKRTEITKQTY